MHFKHKMKRDFKSSKIFCGKQTTKQSNHDYNRDSKAMYTA